MPASLYRRIAALKAHGIEIRRANHFEQTVNEYGEKLTWVIDGGAHRQALRAFRTKAEAVAAAEAYT